MMEMQIRRAADRGHANHGWLDTHHTFSFADYYDEAFMGFRVLRVINEDKVAPGRGFGTHGHRDMEIISYVLSGELGHKDSMGTGSTIKPGEVQRMSAGTGVMHSEMNASKTAPVHFMQIWILPDKQGHKPGYEQKAFPPEERTNMLRVVASPDGRDGSVTIHQNATLSLGALSAGATVEHTLAKGRYAWIQVARGAVVVNDEKLDTSDGVAIAGEGTIRITGVRDGEVLLFDLP
jgi:quercetin 2,3-dioxygenase